MGTDRVSVGETATTVPVGNSDGDEPAAPAGLAPGARIDRYEVVRQLGAGGMGVVYLARDSELARDVALKLVRPLRDTIERLQDRLRREAQAMAKISHPNVVPVFDIGVVDDRLFIAMGSCEGGTLRTWLSGKRTWREVVPVMAAAGRGLAAAHAVGLVHRDFKPDNVLLDAAGTWQVSDFGLVHAAAAPEVASAARSGGGGGATDGFAGTPGYMAPEQLTGQEVSAATDQFAFCVTLHEALHGARPFAAPSGIPTAVGLLAEISGGRRQRRGGRAVPGWLERLVSRGLSADPARRWPSMTALVAALEHTPRRRRRRFVVLGLGGVVAAALVGRAVMAGDPAPGVCRGFEARMSGVWDPAVRAAVSTAFLRDRRPFAAGTLGLVETTLDRYRAGWLARATESCEATEVSRVQPAPHRDLRDRCLSARLLTLRELTTALASIEPSQLEQAPAMVAGLPALAICDDVALLGRVVAPPRDQAQRHRIDELGVLAARVDYLGRMGKLAEARALAEQNLIEARALGYAPALAEALYAAARARSLAASGDVLDTYSEAARVADQAGHDTLRAQALIEVAGGQSMLDVDQAAKTAEAAAAVVTRLGASGDMLGAQLVWARASLALVKGDMKEAIRLQQAAADAYAALDPPQPAALAEIRTDLVGLHLALRHVDEGERELVRARQEVTAAMGPDHPLLGSLLAHQAAIAQERGDLDGAWTAVNQAVELLDRVAGPRHHYLPSVLMTQGAIARERGDHEAALASFRRGHDITVAIFGPDSSSAIAWQVNVAQGLLGLERHAEAIPLLERSLAHFEAHGIRGGELAMSSLFLANALRATGGPRPRIRALLTTARGVYLEYGMQSDVRHIDGLLEEL